MPSGGAITIPNDIQLIDWLESQDLSRYYELFVENDLDFDVLPELTAEHLEALGVSLGHRLKLMRAIRELSQPVEQENTKPEDKTPVRAEPKSGAPAGVRSSHPTDSAERRHLTVMFVDLVGSTRLSTRLDPEDLREVIRDYQEAATREIKRFDGFVSRYMGDGILAYFGWPRAHEDDAERAVRAGLAANGVVAGLISPDGLVLAARSGIASGLVVVGDVIGEGASEEEAVIGETPNLAARLQGVARPGQLVVSEGTRKLVGELFQFESLGRQSLKGIAEPVEAFVVGIERESPSRYHASRKAGQLPLIGREAEIDQLRQRWKIALDGEGQTVVIRGEAGIGKSRIVDAFCAATEENVHQVIIQCSTHHTESALFPVWRWLLMAIEINDTDTNQEKFTKISAYVSRWLADDGFASIAAANLSVDVEAAQNLLEQGSDQLRIDTLNGLVSLFCAMARQQPVVILLEDVHWADPSTRELLEELAAHISDERLMLIMTTRIEGAPDMSSFPDLNKIELNRLGRGASTEIIQQLTDGRQLPEELLGKLLHRTDGVPLYLEELTKTILESGQLSLTPDSFESTFKVESVEIPSSLQDSLMARLDRLSAVRELTQTAAVIGREFSHELLLAVSGNSRANLENALERLLESGLIYRRDQLSTVSYIFKHALIRDAAYNSLLKARRREIHASIADVLTHDERFNNSVEPQLLARHYSDAQNFPRAAEFNLVAAQKALANSANQEAVVHAEAGLAMVSHIGATEREQFEQGLYFSLAMAQRILKGFHSSEYLEAITRAGDLARTNNDVDIQVNCVRGQFNHYFNRGQHKDAYDVIQNRLDPLLAKLDGISPGSTKGANHLYRGEFQLASDELTKMLDGLDSAESYPERTYVLNPVTSTLANLGWTKWLLGYPEQALADGMLAVNIAKEISQPFSFAMAVVWVGHVQCATGYTAEWESTLKSATELIQKYDIQAWAPRVKFLNGKFNARRGDEALASQGRQDMQDALSNIGDRGSRLSWTWMCAQLADEWLQLSHLQEAEKLLDSGIRHGEEHDEKFWLPELYRLKGGLEFSKGADISGAEDWLAKSTALAKSQGARMCELRTLIECCNRSPEDKHQFQKLAELLCVFTEGNGTDDIRLAYEILDDRNNK